VQKKEALKHTPAPIIQTERRQDSIFRALSLFFAQISLANWKQMKRGGTKILFLFPRSRTIWTFDIK
jgi:hypothetical protein